MKCRPRLLIAAAALSLALCAPALGAEFPNLVTAEGAILCANYFAIKEAKTALGAGDKTWFEKTGCVQARGGLRMVVIDDHWRDGSPISEPPWRGRVYPESESEGKNAYFDPWEISAFAVATIPHRNQLPSDLLAAERQLGAATPRRLLWSPGAQPVIFKNAGAAEQWYARHIRASYWITARLIPIAEVPHKVIAESGGFRVLLGPTRYPVLKSLCEDVSWFPGAPGAPPATSCALQ
jgi:hypothetical protein